MGTVHPRKSFDLMTGKVALVTGASLRHRHGMLLSSVRCKRRNHQFSTTWKQELLGQGASPLTRRPVTTPTAMSVTICDEDAVNAMKALGSRLRVGPINILCQQPASSNASPCAR